MITHYNGYFWAEDGHLYSIREYDEMDPKPEPIKVIWVNAYRASRHYGGPEEGGWWYDWNTCIASMPVSTDGIDVHERCDLIKAWMKEALGWEPDSYEHAHGGARFTANGHSDFVVHVESKRAADETKERPFYE